MVAISIVFFVGLYWYYKKSKENFGIILDGGTDTIKGLYTDSDNLLLTDNDNAKGILEILIIQNFTERFGSKDIVNIFNKTFIDDLGGNVGTLKDLQDTNLKSTGSETNILSLDNVEVNLYIGGYDAKNSGAGSGCLLSSDYKKAFDTMKTTLESNVFSEGNGMIGMFNYKTVTCEKYNKTSGFSEWMDVSDTNKQLCTNAGVGFYNLKKTDPFQFSSEKTRHELPLIEFKLSGKRKNKVEDTVQDFTVTNVYKDYQTSSGEDIASGITLTELQLQQNIIDWLTDISNVMLTDSTFPNLVKFRNAEG